MSLTRQRTVITSKLLPFPSPSILELLHSPSDIIHLNPNVFSATASPTDPLEWTVVTRTPVLGGLFYLKSPAITARYEITGDGLISEVVGGGIRVRSTWVCVPTPERRAGVQILDEGTEETCEVTETAELTASVLLIGYVAAALKTSHEEGIEQMEKLLRERAELSQQPGTM